MPLPIPIPTRIPNLNLNYLYFILSLSLFLSIQVARFCFGSAVSWPLDSAPMCHSGGALTLTISHSVRVPTRGQEPRSPIT